MVAYLVTVEGFWDDRGSRASVEGIEFAEIQNRIQILTWLDRISSGSSTAIYLHKRLIGQTFRMYNVSNHKYGHLFRNAENHVK